MITTQPRVIKLKEYEPQSLSREEMPEEVARSLWQNYRVQVSVESPSFITGEQWRLTAQGWVGYIPLTPEISFALEPKMPLGNLFGMLEYAYRLKMQFLEGLMESQSLQEFYERLANILARRVLDRGRKGFYRAYLADTDRLPYVRGRLDVRQVIRSPWDVKLQCDYEEHTPDIEENQILAWTLWRIANSGMCTERVLPTVRQAYRSLQGFVTLLPCSPEDCIRRTYNRLNEDYQPLHALSRFFLEHSGPSHELGNHTMLPFLINMESLFEMFVAEWLKAHLPSGLLPRSQERVEFGEGLHFDIDLVLSDLVTGKVLSVLDTKYKTPTIPGTDDIAQVVAYAEAKECQEAVLVYPTCLPKQLNVKVGNIRVRCLTFAPDGDLEQAGQNFLKDLLT